MEDFTTKDETKPKDDFKTRASHLKEHVSEYVKTYVQIVKSKATRGASDAAAGLVTGVLLFFFGLFFLVFAFTGIAWWLGDVFNNVAAGFFLCCGFFPPPSHSRHSTSQKTDRAFHPQYYYQQGL